MFKKVSNAWNQATLSKRLYIVVGVMATLVTLELFALGFAIHTMSSLRALVNGEALWSKSQKNAYISLKKYVQTGDVRNFNQYRVYINAVEGARVAREEFTKENPNIEKVRAGLLRVENHPDDVEKMINLLRRFSWAPFLSDALVIWAEADQKIAAKMALANQVHQKIQSGMSGDDVRIFNLMRQIDHLNNQLTEIEASFSSTLGEGSRWLEDVVFTVVIIGVLTVECFLLFMTFTFVQQLKRVLRRMTNVTKKMRDGDYELIQTKSNGELKDLAKSINALSEQLKIQTESRKRAERTTRAKNRFLANMSHEIRTPLNALLGFAKMIRDKDLTEEEIDKYHNYISKSGRAIEVITNDLLDHAKIESDELLIYPQPNISIPQLLDEVENVFRLNASKKNLKLKVIKSEKVPDFVSVDEARLRQILYNLVSNAVKFTDKGGVSIRYGADGPMMYFDVVDTGPGVLTGDGEEIFKPFVRGVMRARSASEGSGLGLTISKSLAKLMGGDLVLLKSELGKGAHFRLTLPHVKGSSSTLIDGPSDESISFEGLRGKSILVCEDSEDNRELTGTFLENLGLNVTFVSDGCEAIEAHENKKYDCILMDLQMPRMDGFEVTKHLRARGATEPIIAVSGHAVGQYKESCLKQGFDDFLPKPFDRSQIQQYLAKYIG